ncbi:MAG: hypothetical protein R3327_08570 [Nitrosopumilaceae archaeon]|nr:hypothetical protein [Nitrosopumilaceae archaeon]
MKKYSKILLVAMVAVIGFSGYAYAQQESQIPLWIKTTAGFWVNGQITDQEFITALQYLINQKILTIPSQTETIVIKADELPNVDVLEIPVTDTESKERVLSADQDLLMFKILELYKLAENPTVLDAVIKSNEKFRQMGDEEIETHLMEKDSEWKKTPKNQLSPFMGSLIENNVAKILKEKQMIPTEKFGNVLFPEIMITNEFGAIVASTGRTEDYNQSDEGWWLKALSQDVQIRDLSWDDSAKIYSTDIVIKLVNEKGKFIGVLNAATPIR